MSDSHLRDAKKAKNDEFFTQYHDIEKEIERYIEFNPDVFNGKTILMPCDDPQSSNFTKYFSQNFERFKLKKLISTSFAYDSKTFKGGFQLELFEENSPNFNRKKSQIKGKIFTLSKNKNPNNRTDIKDIKWKYLKGDGDFKSEEVRKLRDEADFIITNPPFSLFREFVEWIMEANKKFIIIGNINCIAYKEVFPLLKDNKVWLGTGIGRWISGFIVPKGYELYGTETKLSKDGERIVSTNSCLWLTNVDHGKRHQPLSLMTMDDNLRFSKHKKIKSEGYKKYDNYDAIEVPFVDAIPSDYNGDIGVPITFLGKYCPEQFKIIKFRKGDDGKDLSIDGKDLYFRIIIRKINNGNNT